MTRDEADMAALTFLRDYGPHTMGQIDDDGALAAAMIFLDLEKAGWVRRVNFGNGHLQFSLTDAGRERIGAPA